MIQKYPKTSCIFAAQISDIFLKVKISKAGISIIEEIPPPGHVFLFTR